MSAQAFSWAIAQDIPRASEKFVLACMCNYADPHWICYPSVTTLARDTSQDRKTVLAALKALRERGFIRDTGRRIGATSGVIIYQIMEQSQKRDTSKEVPETAPFDEGKQSRFSVEAVPKTGHRTVSKEPLAEESDSFCLSKPKEEKLGKKEKSSHTAEAVELYNKIAEKAGWPKAAKLTGKREAGLRRCLQSGGLEEWRRAIEKAAASDFCCGRVQPRDGRKPFLLDLDFLLQETSYVRLLEGRYDNAGGARAGGGLFDDPPVDPERCAQRTAVRLYKERGVWLASEMGAGRPGEPGCRIFPDVLKEFGYGTAHHAV